MVDGLLEIRALRAGYDQAEVLQGVELRLEVGEILFLVGPNGAGKSTLLRCLAGRVPTVAGSVRFDGEDLLAWKTRDRIRKGLVLCPEGRHLFPEMTVEDNLLLGAHHRRDRRATRDDILGLCRQIDWLEARLSQAAGTLSGGEQQMVAVARALMARPRLLLLDEPTIGLSPAAIVELTHWLRVQSAEAGVTVLGAEQNMVFAREVADRYQVLTDGRIHPASTSRDAAPADSGDLASKLFGLSSPHD